MVIFFVSLLLIFPCFAKIGDSITSHSAPYRALCLKAIDDPWLFHNFRSHPEYVPILEVGLGMEFADYLRKNADRETLELIPSLQQIERVGNPQTQDHEGLGRFSGTTLRYILIADQIKQRFALEDNCIVAEIGAGFGGQCTIFSKLQRFSKYYIFDLPEVEQLIKKFTSTFSVHNVLCWEMTAPIPEEKIDLVISNYAFSECDRPTQLDYFERVIKKADRGYFLYNQTAIGSFQMDPLSPDAFVALLKQHGKDAFVMEEPVHSYSGNLLIIWDKM